VIIIIGTLTAFAYTSEQTALKSATQNGLKSTVGAMATQVQASEIAGIKPGDENSERYLAVARHLQALRSMDDQVLNAYILKVYPNKTAVFLVDDLYLLDPQGSAKTGEVSTAPDKSVIFAALSGPTTSAQPYTTKYGSFMSAYAPIDDSVNDSAGNTVAVLAIDVSATNYNNQTSQGGLTLITGLVSMVLAVGAIFFFGARKPEEKKAD
jgi:methyl-accepting chemotaxis protein